jgi:hypothetical protein
VTKLVVVETFTDPLNTHVARGLLESEGIPARRYTRALGSTSLLLATFGLSSIIFPPRIDGRQCNICGSRFGVEDS